MKWNEPLPKWFTGVKSIKRMRFTTPVEVRQQQDATKLGWIGKNFIIYQLGDWTPIKAVLRCMEVETDQSGIDDVYQSSQWLPKETG